MQYAVDNSVVVYESLIVVYEGRAIVLSSAVLLLTVPCEPCKAVADTVAECFEAKVNPCALVITMVCEAFTVVTHSEVEALCVEIEIELEKSKTPIAVIQSSQCVEVYVNAVVFEVAVVVVTSGVKVK